MTRSGEAFVTDRWQPGAGQDRLSMSEDAHTDRLRSILHVDPDFAASAVEFDSATSDMGLGPQTSEYDARRMKADLLPPILPAPSEGRPDRFKLLQKWEGTVVRCSDSEFMAVLREEGEPEQEATFDLEEVPEGDRALVVPGGIFYWSIGYRDRRGQRFRESLIRFRRMPAWTKREIDRAQKEADEIITALHWGSSQTAG